jgi:hypothetical protein
LSRWVDVDCLLISITTVFDSKTATKVTEYIEKYPTIEGREWIPVSERMPEVEGRYIVTLDNDEVGYLLCKNCLWMVNNVVPLAECRVKAWMPLPEPYKAE